MPHSHRDTDLTSVDLDSIDIDEEGCPETCPNCGAERRGPYCHQCGQHFLQLRLSARELAWIFVDRFLDWEQGVWPTFSEMITQPGTVIGRYLDGQRRRYLNPFSYLVICALLYASAQALLRRSTEEITFTAAEAGKWMSALDAVENEYSTLAYATVLGVGLVAPALRVMFDSRMLNTVEAVVAALYASGSVFLYSIPVTLYVFVAHGQSLDAADLAVTFLFLFPFCMAHAGYGLFESPGMAGYTGLAPLVGGMMGVLGAAVLAGIGTFVDLAATTEVGLAFTLTFGALTGGPILAAVGMYWWLR
jgi:hypothetical protein